MRFLVVGAGGVGGYFGARLAADGNEVTFVARGAHATAMAEKGLTVLSPRGDVTITDPQLLGDPREAGIFDVALLCTKLWDLAEAARLIKPLLAIDSAVVPLQNGVTAEETVAEELGRQRVIGGVAYIAATIAEPGVIRHTGDFAALTFGELDGSDSWRVESLHAACQAAGIDAKPTTRIEEKIWEKFIFLAPLAGATAYFRSDVGGLRDDPKRRQFFEELVEEVTAVARAKGITFKRQIVEHTIAVFKKLPSSVKSSMLHDLEQSRPLELNWLNGEVVRQGRDLGITCPRNCEVFEALRASARL